jgi:hypothetical protein
VLVVICYRCFKNGKRIEGAMKQIQLAYISDDPEDRIKIALLYHICDNDKEMKRVVKQRNIICDTDYYAICGHPTVYADYEDNTANIEVPIFLSKDDVQESYLWHETYHATKMINHLLDCLHPDVKFSNEEFVADIAGYMISEARKSVLKEYKN